MSNPRKHHFLPKSSYLAHFECPEKKGFVWFYRREQDPVLVNLLKTGAKKDLYTITNANNDPDYTIEKEILGKIDSWSAPVLKRLNSPLPPFVLKNSLLLTITEKNILAGFVAFLATRTPTFRSTLKAMYEGMVKTTSQILAANKEGYRAMMEKFLAHHPEFQGKMDIEEQRRFDLEGNYEIEAEGDNYFLGQSLELSYSLHPAILMKEIAVLKASEGSFFVTSDHPVLLKKDPDVPKFIGAGFLTSTVILPIGSTTALWLSNSRDPWRPVRPADVEYVPFINISKQGVNEINEFAIASAEDCVIASQKDDRIPRLLAAAPKRPRFSLHSPFTRKPAPK